MSFLLISLENPFSRKMAAFATQNVGKVLAKMQFSHNFHGSLKRAAAADAEVEVEVEFCCLEDQRSGYSRD